MTEALVTARRGFLVRALGITAAGTSIAVPVLALPAPEERLRHHLVEAARAMQELFPTAKVAIQGNCINGYHRYYAEMFASGEWGGFEEMAFASLVARPRRRA